LFAAVTTLAAFLVMEAGLRFLGFEYGRSLSYMRFNFPNPNELHQVFEPDPFLLWRMRPGFDFGEGFGPLNSRGFRGPEIPLKKPPATLRIACLGDSVTFGRPGASYPALLEKKLSEKLGRPVEAMNFGVPGYSSWQGMKLLPETLDLYEPDVVIILFGWNDHWLAMGYSDKDQIVADTDAPVVLDLIRGLRVYQLLNKSVARLKPGGEKPRTLRVSPGEYRYNLDAMIRVCRRSNAFPILATSPSAISLGHVPEFLTHLEFIRAPEELAELHGLYNEISRRAASENQAPLIDLDLIFNSGDVTSLFEDPENDLIHPNPRGYELVAESIAGELIAIISGLE
jgi:lysophospholipase L1-like esterase